MNLKKLIANSIYSVATFGGSVILELLAATIYVSYLKVSGFGIYSFYVAFISYISFIDFGVPRGITKFISEKVGLGEIEESEKFVSQILNLLLIYICILTVLIYFLFGYLFDNSGLWEVFSKSQLSLIKVITIVGLFLAFISNFFDGILKGYQDYKTTSIAYILSRILSVVGGIFIAIFTQSIILLLVSFLFFYLSSITIKLFKLKGKFKLQRFDALIIKQNFLQFFSFSWYSFLDNILLQSVFRLPMLILGVLTNAESVGLYSIGHKMSVAAHGIFQSSTETIFPYISNKARNISNGLKENYLLASNIIITFGIITYSIIFLLSEQIISLWMNTEVANVSHRAASVLSIGFFALSITTISRNFLMGLGKVKYLVVSSLAGLFLILITIVPLTHALGYYGTSYSVLIGCSFTMFFYLFFISRALDIDITKLLSIIIFNVLRFSFIIIVIFLASNLYSTTIPLFCKLLVGIIIYLTSQKKVIIQFKNIIKSNKY